MLAEVQAAADEAVDAARRDVERRGVEIDELVLEFLLEQLHLGIVQTAAGVASGFKADAIAWRAYVDEVYRHLAVGAVTVRPRLRQPRRYLSTRLLDD